MSHAFDAVTGAAGPGERRAARRTGPLGAVEDALAGVNRLILVLGGLALVAACLVLTYSVVVRYVLRVPTDWQDETAVFLIVGATFLSAAAVQARRGHVAIEALAGILTARVNAFRLVLADAVSLAFCAFFAWKSWTLLHEAWVDGQTSSSTWAPPLWVPYALMASGMTLLVVQIALQLALALASGPAGAGWASPAIGVAAPHPEKAHP